ncbi:hypothetical protein DN752_23925 [Echinicola strongylocentroti]|uniref:Uncharacterized protein n=1 Tax=Echinicola strongylocentroti TaxID=1795355 RepID=A0A2Z4IQD5_9BACT|nr:hypothetical protein [Echinicola strongylocentroti]AWW32929.1 hypothetical protein DN752_23925 [Echinicola strongylocentroti]
MKRLLSIFILLFAAVQFTDAQNFPSQVWHDGSIYLTTGDVHKGKVKYDLEKNIVQLQSDGVHTYNSSSISRFEIFDEYYGGMRSFYSLPYDVNNNNYEVPIFFELLTEGDDITLLCREYITTDTRNMGMYNMYMSPMYGPPMSTTNKLAFDYFFLTEGKIVEYSQKRKDLLGYMEDREDEVKLYMRKNRLDCDRRGDLLRITAYYNKLKDE